MKAKSKVKPYLFLKKEDLYRLTYKFERLIIKSFNEHFKLILNNLSKSHTKEITNYIKKHKEKIQESIFSKNLKRNILLILLKNNCVCRKNTEYCYCCRLKDEIHTDPTPIIEPSNWGETKANHAFRKKGKKEKVSIKYASKNISNYTIGKSSGKVHHKSIFLLPIKLSENSLFDKTVLDNLSGNSQQKSLMAGVLEKGSTRMQELIMKSVHLEMIFFSRISIFYHMLKAIQVVYSKSLDKRIIAETEELKYIDEGLKFIETTTGAGIFYLTNTQFTGYISLEAVKNYMKSRKTYKFTEDHIYRRKLAAKFLLNKKLTKVEDLYEIYTEKFSFISLLHSSENKLISKISVDEKTISSDTKKYLTFYTEKLAGKKVDIIKIKIKSKDLLKKCINYLMEENHLNSKSKDSEIKDNLEKYTKIFKFWIN